MEITLSTFFNVLAKPPGDLVFHLVVCLALILLISITLGNLKSSQSGNQPKRILIGCGIILFFQLLLFVLRPLNQQYSLHAINFYPIYERLTATLTIPWLVWIFSDHEQHSIPTYLLILLSCALIIFAGASIIVMPRLSLPLNFNLALLDLLWQFTALALILIGLVLTVFNPPPQKLILILILLLLAGGHILQILLLDNLQWNMGAIRFAQILSLPWILTLTQRFSQDKKQEQFQEIKSEIGYSEMPIDTKPTLIKLLLEINLTQTIEEKNQAIARALSHTVIADICYLVKVSQKGDKVYIMTGYDLIRETFQQADIIGKEDLPHIMASWKENQVCKLSTNSSKTRDATTLTMLLNYHGIGNLYAYPLSLPDKSLTGGVIFLSPYTAKSWGNKTKQLLDEINDSMVQILFAPNTEEQAKFTVKQLKLQVNAMLKEQEHLRQALNDKEAQIRDKESAIKELKAKHQIEKIETVTNIEKMKKQIAELTSNLVSQRNFSNQIEHMKAEIRELQSEKEQLSTALSQANAIIGDLETQSGQTGPIRLSLDSEIISLDSIAANIRLQAASILKQKDIDLEIYNPDGRLMIKTDPELLQTALLELITNAIMASSLGGTIRLDQKLSFEMGILIFQVTDFGDGLSQDEQTALFSGQHDTIQGIGDVQAIRKAIRAIRVLNGKIWLKSKKASYTTFRFQIPVRIID